MKEKQILLKLRAAIDKALQELEALDSTFEYGAPAVAAVAFAGAGNDRIIALYELWEKKQNNLEQN